MGLLSDFFIAHPETLAPEVLDGGPDGLYPMLSVKGVTNLHMELLLGIIEGIDADEVIDRSEELGFEVTDAGSSGPWLTRLPDALRDHLATAPSASLQEWVERCMQLEDFSGGSRDDLTSLLRRLSDLARRAQATGASLYLWMCL